MVTKFSTAMLAVVVLAMTLVSSALATPDPVLTSASSDLTSYFTDNLPVVIGAFIAIALAVWILRMLFRSVGVGKPRSVN